MPTTFADLDEFFSPGLVLTVRGRAYTVPLPSAELGLWCRRMLAATGQLHAASTPEEMRRAAERIDALPEPPGDLSFEERVLGDAYQQMVADGVPDPYVQFAARTAYTWIAADEATARRFWESGGNPKAPTNRAERRQTRTSSTGGAPATPSPASTSGTSTRQRSGSSGRGRRSRGRRS